MSREDWELFNAIIDEFEESYRATNAEDGVEESPRVRCAYYSACLSVVRHGAPMKSAEVQRSLVQFFSRKLSEELKKVLSCE